MNLQSIFSRLVILGTVIVSLNLNATEEVVATVKNDETQNLYKLVVDSAEEDHSIKTFYKDVFQGGRRINREVIDINVLMSTGMIVEQRDKYVVLKLKSNNFDKEQGGIIEIDTLYSGIKNERRSYQVQLAKSQVGWAIFSRGKKVKEIYIQSNKVLVLGVVGIKNVIMK
jgi:hypothetical protein